MFVTLCHIGELSHVSSWQLFDNALKNLPILMVLLLSELEADRYRVAGRNRTVGLYECSHKSTTDPYHQENAKVNDIISFLEASL